MNNKLFSKSAKIFEYLTFLFLLPLSYSTFASGIPACEDDECTKQKTLILQKMLKPIVSKDEIPSTSELISFFSKYRNLSFDNDYGKVLIAKRPFWGVESIQIQSKEFVRVNFLLDEICIRRVDVESTFSESWRSAKTPNRWFDRDSKPDEPHKGSMSFREDQHNRFAFSFKPSGCAYTFLFTSI